MSRVTPKAASANEGTSSLSATKEIVGAQKSAASAASTKRRSLEESPEVEKKHKRFKGLRKRLKFWRKGNSKSPLNKQSTLSRSRESLTSSTRAAQRPDSRPRQFNFDRDAQKLVDVFYKNETMKGIVKKQLLAPQAELKTEINSTMLSVLMKVSNDNQETAYQLLERIKSGERIESVVKNFKFKIEFKTLQDVQELIARLENNEAEIANFLVKIEDGSESNEDRLSLSKLLRQNQADIEIASKHINDAVSSHIKKSNEGAVNMLLMASLLAMKERVGAHNEVCVSFINRYGDFLPYVTPFHSLDDAERNIINLLSVSEALKANSSILKEKNAIDDASKLDLANKKVETRIERLRAKRDTRKLAMGGDYDSNKRLSRKLSRDVAPISFKLDLAKELLPTKEQIELGRSLVINNNSWKEVYYDNSIANARGERKTYTSVLTPASATGGVAGLISPSYGGSASVQSIANIHAPNLAAAELQNENGKTIYASMRHAALDPTNIKEQNFRNLSKENTKLVLGESGERGIKLFSDMARVRDVLVSGAQIKKNTFQGMQNGVADNMATELIKMQLLYDKQFFTKVESMGVLATNAPEGLPPLKVLDKNTPAIILPFNTINLMGKSNNDKRTIQLKALRRVAAGGRPINVQVKGRDGEIYNVPVRVQLREFNFNLTSEPFSVKRLFNSKSSNISAAEWGYTPTNSNKALSSLLGRKGNHKIGGETGDKLEELDIRIDFLRKELEAARKPISDNDGFAPVVIEAIWDSKAKQDQLVELEASRARLAIPAEQLKSMWRSGNFSSKIGENNKFTARLALLCSELGQPAAMSDINGMDRVSSCDAEAQYLAAQLHTNADLPPLDGGYDRAIRGDFLMSGGSNELRRYNEGLTN